MSMILVDGEHPEVAKRKGQIPPEHIRLVMNSLLCERLFDFKRLLGTDGKFTWTGIRTGAGGQEETVHELMDIVDDPGTALRVLQRFCEHQKWGFAITKGIGEPMFTVQIFFNNGQGEPSLIGAVTAQPFGLGAAFAIAASAKFDPIAQHRILFPGHYMANTDVVTPFRR